MESTTTQDPPPRQAQGGRNPFGELLKSASMYTVVLVVQRSMNILLLPLYTRYLSRADYGVIELLDFAHNLVALLVGMRLGQSLFFYYHTAHDPVERQKYVSTAWIGAITLGLITAAAGSLMAEPLSRLIFKTPQYAGLVRLSFVGFAFSFGADLGFCYMRVTDRVKIYAKVTLATLPLAILLNITLLSVFRMGPASLLVTSAVVPAIRGIWTGSIILSEIPIRFHLPSLKRMTFYSIPLAIGAIGELTLNFGDRAFLRDAVTLSELGLYALAYKFGMVVQSITMPFFAYWNSQMVGITRRPHGNYTYSRMATYLLLGLATAVLMLTVFASPMLMLLASPNFRAATKYIPWIALAYLLRGMGTYWSNTFLIVKRPSLVARNTWTGAAACLLAYALLIPRYGLWGAIVATLLGYALMAGLALWRSQKLRPFHYEYGRWIKISACALVAAVPSQVFHPAGPWAQIAVGMACMALFAGLLGLTGFASAGERRVVINGLRRRLRLRPTA